MNDTAATVLLVVAVVLLLVMARPRREKRLGPLSRRAVGHLLDDDAHRNDGDREGGRSP